MKYWGGVPSKTPWHCACGETGDRRSLNNIRCDYSVFFENESSEYASVKFVATRLLESFFSYVCTRFYGA